MCSARKFLKIFLLSISYFVLSLTSAFDAYGKWKLPEKYRLPDEYKYPKEHKQELEKTLEAIKSMKVLDENGKEIELHISKRKLPLTSEEINQGITNILLIQDASGKSLSEIRFHDEVNSVPFNIDEDKSHFDNYYLLKLAKDSWMLTDEELNQIDNVKDFLRISKNLRINQSDVLPEHGRRSYSRPTLTPKIVQAFSKSEPLDLNEESSKSFPDIELSKFRQEEEEKIHRLVEKITEKTVKVENFLEEMRVKTGGPSHLKAAKRIRWAKDVGYYWKDHFSIRGIIITQNNKLMGYSVRELLPTSDGRRGAYIATKVIGGLINMGLMIAGAACPPIKSACQQATIFVGVGTDMIADSARGAQIKKVLVKASLRFATEEALTLPVEGDIRIAETVMKNIGNIGIILGCTMEFFYKHFSKSYVSLGELRHSGKPIIIKIIAERLNYSNKLLDLAENLAQQMMEEKERKRFEESYKKLLKTNYFFKASLLESTYAYDRMLRLQALPLSYRSEVKAYVDYGKKAINKAILSISPMDHLASTFASVRPIHLGGI